MEEVLCSSQLPTSGQAFHWRKQRLERPSTSRDCTRDAEDLPQCAAEKFRQGKSYEVPVVSDVIDSNQISVWSYVMFHWSETPSCVPHAYIGGEGWTVSGGGRVAGPG